MYTEKTEEARRVELLKLAAFKKLLFVENHSLGDLEDALLFSKNAVKCSGCKAIYDSAAEKCVYCDIKNPDFDESMTVTENTTIENRKPREVVQKLKVLTRNESTTDLVKEILLYSSSMIIGEFKPNKKYNLYSMGGKKFYICTIDNLIQVHKSWCPSFLIHEGIEGGYKTLRYDSLDVVKNILKEIVS